MTYRVSITPEALREMAKLPQRLRGIADRKILSLAEDPYPPGHKKLKGLQGLYRIKFARDYRILYRIRNQVLTVIVIRVAHRKEVYRRL